MIAHCRLGPRRRVGLRWAALLLGLAMAALAGCPESRLPGEQEEVPTPVEEVPIEVRTAAVGYCDRMGGARCEEWFWDREDQVWECTLSGLTRRAELDVAPDGSFSELELVYDFAEVEKILPDVAEMIRTQSRTDSGILIELSLRRVHLLDDIPELEEAWKLSGVVLEFQAPNGRDFEIDARGMQITKPVDDKTDPSTHTPRSGERP
jgi:hypothetical protein